PRKAPLRPFLADSFDGSKLWVRLIVVITIPLLAAVISMGLGEDGFPIWLLVVLAMMIGFLSLVPTQNRRPRILPEGKGLSPRASHAKVLGRVTDLDVDWVPAQSEAHASGQEVYSGLIYYEYTLTDGESVRTFSNVQWVDGGVASTPGLAMAVGREVEVTYDIRRPEQSEIDLHSLRF
ncbi:MAG: hypothetical protein MI919_36995, partial [Holophagales bacterium]|nr:hypothetical protein [Holophagales bacterium]